LYDYWRDRLGERLLTVDYDRLTRNPIGETALLYAYCGLSADVARPELPSRAVATASFAQVREPIYTRAVGAAEPYRAHLQPFLNAYRAAGGKVD